MRHACARIPLTKDENMAVSTDPRPRTRSLLLAGAVAGTILAVTVPLAASAHVHVDPETAPAGTTSTITFALSHGCDDSPTTALVIDIPDGVGNATPVVQGGWTITRALDSNGVPTQVTFTADKPVESGLKATVSLDVLFDDRTANTSVAFPITQQCVTGSTEWTQIAAEGQDPEDLESPAPVVTVGAVSGDGGDDHHGAAAGADDDHGTGSGEAGDAEHPTAADEQPGDPVARWLAGGALVVGIAALVVTLVRGRTRKG